jgi:hypothetical protein
MSFPFGTNTPPTSITAGRVGPDAATAPARRSTGAAPGPRPRAPSARPADRPGPAGVPPDFEQNAATSTPASTTTSIAHGGRRVAELGPERRVPVGRQREQHAGGDERLDGPRRLGNSRSSSRAPSAPASASATNREREPRDRSGRSVSPTIPTGRRARGACRRAVAFGASPVRERRSPKVATSPRSPRTHVATSPLTGATSPLGAGDLATATIAGAGLGANRANLPPAPRLTSSVRTRERCVKMAREVFFRQCRL